MSLYPSVSSRFLGFGVGKDHLSIRGPTQVRIDGRRPTATNTQEDDQCTGRAHPADERNPNDKESHQGNDDDGSGEYDGSTGGIDRRNH